MNIYLVHFDDQPDYVEAESFTDAIRLWTDFMQAREGLTPDGRESFCEEPESVALIHNEPAIRKRHE